MPQVSSLVDSIEELFDKKPDKRKKKDYSEWKETINKLIEQVNAVTKFKMYSPVK